jgi:hypothetical protein
LLWLGILEKERLEGVEADLSNYSTALAIKVYENLSIVYSTGLIHSPTLLPFLDSSPVATEVN